MRTTSTLAPEEMIELDRIYREGGLRAMASPHVHYDSPNCPHPGCAQTMEWIDFKLELHGDPEGIYKPLVKAWWDGRGFIGGCPGCGNSIRFTTLKMEPAGEAEASPSPTLPTRWWTLAQIA